MLLHILKSTNCDGRRVYAGQVVDASERDGRFLLSIGFAVQASQVPAVDEPAPKKRGRPKKSPVNRMEESDVTR